MQAAHPDAGVVLVTTSYPTAGDGSEAAGAFVRDLALEMARWAPVRVVAPGPAAGVEEHGGVTVIRYRAPAKPLGNLRLWHPVEGFRIGAVMLRGLKATTRATKLAPTRRIVALWALPSGFWARRAAREAGIPYDVWTLGSDVWSLGRVPITRRWLREILRGAQRRFSDGKALAAETESICDRRVEFLPSTRRIASRRELPPKDRPPYRILYLGRWHRNKGIDLFLESLAQLTDADWNRIESVTIHGGGPLAPLVHEQAAALAARGRPLHVGGYLDHASAERAIAAADFLVIPSRIESIPVVFSDAIKLECPVIATPVGDLPSLIDTGVGHLAAAVSPSAIADALRTATASSPRASVAAMRRLAEQFDLSRIASVLVGER